MTPLFDLKLQPSQPARGDRRRPCGEAEVAGFGHAAGHMEDFAIAALARRLKGVSARERIKLAAMQ